MGNVIMATANPEIRIHNSTTGEVIDRPMTDVEYADNKAQQVMYKAQQAEATAKADARVSALAKLAKLGLTEAEIEAL